ncbi:MAG: hypothetical protein NT062_07545 [Proteobacteria bacterium]|nr:hypothetical protein [Pseudomonadota bacterium]
MNKLALTWSFSIAMIVVASCSITHHSNEYTCTSNAECTDGRTCSQGYCVVTGGTPDAPTDPKIDAFVRPDARPVPDAPMPDVCPPGCSNCNIGAKECIIECGAPGAQNCQQPIACPTGWNCQIACSHTNDCRSGVSCVNAASCTIDCAGAGSCRGVSCGNGPCDVTCGGYQSCSQQINCNNSCQCDVTCSGPGTANCGGSAGQAVSCGQVACDAIDGGCTSQPANNCSSTCN